MSADILLKCCSVPAMERKKRVCSFRSLADVTKIWIWRFVRVSDAAAIAPNKTSAARADQMIRVHVGARSVATNAERLAAYFVLGRQSRYH